MACESTGVNDRRLLQFSKIRIMDDIATAIGNAGQESGAVNFMDLLDMTCGAIPEGNFEQVIDLNAPHQFLSMYMQMAEYRLAFAVVKLSAGEGEFYNAIKNFCMSAGENVRKNMAGPDKKPATALEALELYEAAVLDGMPCDETKQYTKQDVNEVSWEKTADTHKEFWEKSGGSVEIYYELLQCFADGLFKDSAITFTIKDCQSFTILKK